MGIIQDSRIDRKADHIAGRWCSLLDEISRTAYPSLHYVRLIDMLERMGVELATYHEKINSKGE